jgi:hypothetical protein
MQFQQYNTGALGQGYQQATQQQLSGTLAPSQLQLLNQRFGQNMSQANSGAFGMPSGAAAFGAQNVASNNALQGALMGQQNIQTGQNNAMQYMNFGAGQNALGQEFNADQSFKGYESQMAAQQAADASGGGLLGGLASAGMSAIMPGLSGYISQNVFGQQPKPDYMQKMYESMFGGNNNSSPIGGH